MLAGFFKYTRTKIIVSYILLFILSLLAVIFIYRQITRMAVEEEGVSEANQKLFIISSTITQLYEAEALINVFMQTGSGNTFNRYINIMQQVEADIDSLHALSSQPDQQNRLDSISLLLEEKTKNLQALIKAKESLTNNEFYNRAMASIEAERNFADPEPKTRQHLETVRDSVYVKNEKKRKNFWSWLSSKPKKDSSLIITSSLRTVVDTLSSPLSSQNADTVVNILKSVWEDVQEKRKTIVRQINQAEYDIIAQSMHITDQLRRILNEYEKEELTNSFRKIEHREKVVNTTTHIIAWVAVLAFLIILLFSFFILRDLSRSQRYRRKLENANHYADQLLESREKMIQTVTHDIKSPLSSVIGYIELLNATPVNERQRYFLKNMQGSSEHILKLVGNLLDLSKLENNKMPVEEITFNPAQLFREISDTFIPLAIAKHLTLSCKIGEDLNAGYKGDALRIRQIITNILSNAVKYTVQGTISFSAVNSTDDGRIILRIKDTGTGMTPEEQKIIFQEFARLKSHTAIEGTGLGLTITLKLIHLLGGEIRLDSEPDKGSCFTIILPLTLGTADNRQISATAAIKTIRIEKLKILLVDDDPLQLEMTSNLLHNQGIEAETTTQPEEVAGKLQAGHYDMVFSDIQMPGISGFEVVKNIRKLSAPFAGTIPVVALSADSSRNEEDYLQAGFTAYLPKPFTSSQLMELITLLAGQEDTQSPEPQDTTSLSGTEEYTLKNILQFADNDKEALQKIIGSFVKETQQHIQLLKNYHEEKQWNSVTRLAHKILPIFRQLEAREIIEALQKLEQSDKNQLSEQEMQGLTTSVISKIKELSAKIQVSASEHFIQ